MIIQCERCKETKECSFAGHASDVEKNEAQNGEWLCQECGPLRLKELDQAIEKLKDILGK